MAVLHINIHLKEVGVVGNNTMATIVLLDLLILPNESHKVC